MLTLAAECGMGLEADMGDREHAIGCTSIHNYIHLYFISCRPPNPTTLSLVQSPKDSNSTVITLTSYWWTTAQWVSTGRRSCSGGGLKSTSHNKRSCNVRMHSLDLGFGVNGYRV